MKVDYSCENGVLKYYFEPEEDDHIDNGIVKMANKSCEVHLPKDWDLNSVHPDVMALSSILIVYFYIGKRLILPFGVSKAFYDYFLKLTDIEVLPIDESLKPRKAPIHSVGALAYSGGIDSTAALALLPKNTVSVYIDRIIPKGTKTLYRKEAEHFACESLRKLGRSVYTVKTDFVYIRDPVGYILEESTCIPALLLSDYAGFDSIAHGIHFIYAYKVFYPAFRDFSKSDYFKLWGGIFEIVDMPLNLVTAGLSEVGTTKVVLESPYAGFAQYCVRGDVGKPCLNCLKCFRKKMLEMVVTGQKMDDEILNRLFKIQTLMYIFEPDELEITFSYITSKYNGKHELMNLLKKKTRGDVLELEWMEKWYSPSIQVVAPKYRSFLEKKIKESFEIMSWLEEENVKSLHLAAFIESDEFRQDLEKLIKAYKAYLSKN